MSADRHDDHLLRLALRADATFSAASALVLVAAAGPVGRFLDVPTWIPLVIGLSFVPWVVMLLLIAVRRPVEPTHVWAVVAGNVAWVVGTAVLLIGFPDALSSGGRIAAAIAALVVADFAVVQTIALRRQADHASASTKKSSAWQATSPST